MRMVRAFTVVLIAAAVLPLQSIAAQNVTPSFGATVPGSWFTDRYAPTTFALTNATDGRNNVLNIGITSAGDYANRPAAYQSTFYDTQGEGYDITAPAGSYTLTADLWVNGNWDSNDNGTADVRTDMWGVSDDAGGNAEAYPIIGFTNAGGTGLFRGYDVNTGLWDNFSAPVVYNSWNTLSLSWNSTTDVYSYYVNGALAGSVTGDGGAVGIDEIIMQAYNFNDPTLGAGYGSGNYTALWSNTPGGNTLAVTPEPTTVSLMALGLVGMVGMRRRKRSR